MRTFEIALAVYWALVLLLIVVILIRVAWGHLPNEDLFGSGREKRRKIAGFIVECRICGVCVELTPKDTYAPLDKLEGWSFSSISEGWKCPTCADGGEKGEHDAEVR